jgi:hypothetical protein
MAVRAEELETIEAGQGKPLEGMFELARPMAVEGTLVAGAQVSMVGNTFTPGRRPSSWCERRRGSRAMKGLCSRARMSWRSCVQGGVST